MSRLAGFLPVAQGVAAYAALTRHADGLKAGGDPRSRGQIMADTFVERLTGQATATAIPVEVELMISADALLPRADEPARRGDASLPASDEPAQVVGFGPLPGPLARDLVRDTTADVWLRRVFTRPDDGALVAMESRRRLFPDGLRKFVVLRDQTCRTPWCGAPIRHSDHVAAVETGGVTSADNGQGLCAACNQTKQVRGWYARPGPAGAGRAVHVTTPTGHTYTSRPPPVLGRDRNVATSPMASHDESVLEASMQRLLDAA